MSSQRGARSPDEGRPRVSGAPVVRNVSIRRTVLVTGLAVLLFSSALALFFFGGGALGRPPGAPPSGPALLGSVDLGRTDVAAADRPSGMLQITGFSFAPTMVSLGNDTTITVNATSPGGPLTYAYGGLPPGCESTNASRLACRPTAAGSFDVTMSVRDVAGDLASVSGNLTVHPLGAGAGALVISGFGSSPGNVTVGGSVVLSVVASGGSGPLTYRYPTLPAGCSSANTSALPCAPSAPGNYALYVVVSDAVGDSQGAVGALLVSPSVPAGPSVSAFFATPANVTFGNSTTLIAEARGTLPLSYAYTGLPPGCVSQNTSVLNCTPEDVGTFHVSVAVVDAHGRLASANTSFTDLVSTGGPKGPAHPVASSGTSSPPVLLWTLVGVAAGAAVSFAPLQLALGRRRLRRDGLEIVRELSRSSAPSETRPSERDDP
ncbi:MAG: hypothetical protein L3K00_07100 [Thermoplasmata archaeon]|nr:hypothetical protein [Thermoplasmata archaeon]MCI4362404.1 hypothetical protein [Thermoplasmata archaeon]